MGDANNFYEYWWLFPQHWTHHNKGGLGVVGYTSSCKKAWSFPRTSVFVFLIIAVFVFSVTSVFVFLSTLHKT